ncbi:ACT domain-containing protein [Pseudoruegeria aquimaris]|uniref:ACT domain-containing protein n=1 Tax=Pseudoruegeria aquimaris TaxID=393663 RepID=UPI001C393617|nr:ACT domain-containing protein [Pseudoruegeria aquimaris]
MHRTEAMIAGMAPRLQPGLWAFHTVDAAALTPDLLARAAGAFREEEGLSLILPAAPGEALAMAQITLQVHSALDGVGLTAAASGALAAEGIPANVVAANHHDHIFVPAEMAEAALRALTALAAEHAT